MSIQPKVGLMTAVSTGLEQERRRRLGRRREPE